MTHMTKTLYFLQYILPYVLFKKEKKNLLSHLMEYVGSNFCYSIVTKKKTLQY